MLALERKATLHPSDRRMTVKAQPFGGALRINSLLPLKERLGDFHFDSGQSRSERDFRLYIRPSAWGAVRDYCLEQFGSPDGRVLESGPDRELVEEIGEILGVDLSPDQYHSRPLWTVLEDQPVPTRNIHADGQPTVRLYRVFEVHIIDSGLVGAMISEGQRYSDHELGELARKDVHNDGRGWANAMLVTPLERLISFYQAMPEDGRNSPAEFEGHNLEPNVTLLLEGVWASKYQLSTC